MKIKIAILSFLYFAAGVFTACCPRCEDVDAIVNFSFTEVQLKNLVLRADGVHVETDADTINQDDYDLRVIIQGKEQNKETAMLKIHSNLFFSSANAFQCEECRIMSYKPVDSISEVKIFDLDNEGNLEDVTNKFLLLNNSGDITLQDFLKSYNFYGPGSVGAINDVYVFFDCKFSADPVEVGVHQFLIKVYLKSGATLEKRTKVVYLK